MEISDRIATFDDERVIDMYVKYDMFRKAELCRKISERIMKDMVMSGKIIDPSAVIKTLLEEEYPTNYWNTGAERSNLHAYYNVFLKKNKREGKIVWRKI